MYTIYRNKKNGRELVAEGVNYRNAEVYRQFIPHCIVEDSANALPSDIDTIEPEDYGVKDKRVMESAAILLACIGGGALLVTLALLTQ